MNNPMQMMQMFQQMMSNGNMNPNQMMQMFGGNPMFQQAQKMLNSGGNPQEIIMNVAKQKGIETSQLQQMAQQFGIKL